jgi:type I restriction enzyme M protein
LIKAIVEVMRPAPGMTLCDPACGTGGFFLAAHDYVSRHYALHPDQKRFLRDGTFKGGEIVEGTARLCVMNLYLRGIGGEVSPIVVGDSLAAAAGERFDLVLTNPPFGRKSSVTSVSGADGAAGSALAYQRGDFWVATFNKQLNFLQHVKTLLQVHGRAAIVVPDNVLFEGGAGEAVRRGLLRECDVHTLLRLPTGVFYAPGVKANVLFFDKPAREKPWTERLWVDDLRTNKHFTLKQHPLRDEDLQDFVACYHPENRHARWETERFRAFDYAALLQRDQANLDILWLKDVSLDVGNLPAPDVLAGQIVENLQVALEQFSSIYKERKRDMGGDLD